MAPSRPTMLYVGHDASRTGAPTLGLTFLRWLVARHEVDVEVLLLGGGPLVDAHRSLAPTRVARPRSQLASLAAARVDWKPPRPPALLRGHRAARVVLANTIAALEPARRVARPGDRLVCWVHELDGVADRLLPPTRRARTLGSVDQFVAAGHPVAEMLQHRWGVPRSRITTVDGFVAPRATTPVAPHARRVDLLGAGSVVRRKGVDAFFATIATIATGRPDLTAAWIGDRGESTALRAEVRRDLGQAPLAGRAELVAEVDDLDPWLSGATVFLHTAREDPFPLVVLEAGQHGLPVVTWDTGGAADLLRDAGLPHLVAAPGDLIGLARRVEALLDDPDARHAAGTELQRAVRARSVERGAPLVWSACDPRGGR